MAPKKLSAADRREILAKKRDNERKRLERIRQDPELRALQQQKERLKYARKKEKGLVKPIAEMTRREHSQKKRQWKANTKAYRERKKKVNEMVEPALPSTPSVTHDENEVQYFVTLYIRLS